MKPEKAKDLRQLTKEELIQKLDSFKKDLFGLKFQAKSGQIENPDSIKTIKRNIARILTVLKEKENAAR
jgi:large subunit ribosomal protein L29